MPGIDALRRQVVAYRELALDLYDKLEAQPENLKALLATSVDNRQTRDNPVRLEEAMAFPDVWAWHDQVIAGATLERISWTVPLAGYSAAVPYNKVNIDRPSTVFSVESIIRKLPAAFLRKQVQLLMNVFRAGGSTLAYDGQYFFDTDHTHPASKGTYSNVLAPNWSTTGSPTFAEASSALTDIRARFVLNLALDSEVIDGQTLSDGLVVIVHNATHWAMFEQVRSLVLVPGTNEPNPWRGGFRLLLDNKPTGGQEDYLEAVIAVPGGPRPAFFVIDSDPEPEVWEDNAMPNGYVAVGMKGIFGVKGGFPQVAIQVRPT